MSTGAADGHGHGRADERERVREQHRVELRKALVETREGGADGEVVDSGYFSLPEALELAAAVRKAYPDYVVRGSYAWLIGSGLPPVAPGDVQLSWTVAAAGWHHTLHFPAPVPSTRSGS